MKTDVEYLIFRLENGNCYRINKNNIIEFNGQIKKEMVDYSYFGVEMGLQETPIIDSLLVVIDDYNNIIPLETEENYHPEDESISFVRIGYKNDEAIDAFVNMSDREYNRNQINGLKGNTLFITIENN